MTNAAPELSASDIQLEVERIFSKKRRSLLTAFHGRGQPGTVIAAGQEWDVVPTTCELELRARMPSDKARTPRGTVFLVDWTDRPLALDLACRLAGGRAYQVSRSTRLAGLFGARDVESSLLGTGLAAVVLAGELPKLKKVSGLRLTRCDALRRVLNAWADFPISEGLTPGRLAQWSLRNGAGRALAAKAEESEPWRRLRRELEELVESDAGRLGRLVWNAWLQDEVPRFVEVLLLVDAHARRGDAVAGGVLQGRLLELAPGFGVELLEQMERFPVAALLGELFDALPTAELMSLVSSADSLIPLASFTSTREASPWLPSGHAARERGLAAAVTALVAKPCLETFTPLKAALQDLEAHWLDRSHRTADQRETRLMAVRLAAYLSKRAQEPLPPAGYAHQPAIDLARDHACEGGFVDWCRGRLRAPLPHCDELNQALYRVLEAADSLRRQDDQRFATALVEWHLANRPGGDAVPIHRVTQQLVADLLQGHDDRRILIVLMDGMGWASAVQLLHRLEEEQWEPIQWRPAGFGGREHFPPVLAELPTLTPVSRAAFFAGRVDPKAGDRPTYDDRARWAGNVALDQASGHAALPELVLRDGLMDGESLQGAVSAAISSDSRVVGVVVNAIDEELRGSSQVMRDYSRVPIKPLVGLMTAAAGAERLVLLASDHGHVLGDAARAHGLPMIGRTAGGKRWRTLGPDDTLYPFEVELPKAVWRPPSSERIAAIWDESVVHSHPDHGEHGGVSMAEVVAPAVLLAPNWLHELRPDPTGALKTRPLPLPGWWELEVQGPRSAVTSEPVAAAPPPPQQRTLGFATAAAPLTQAPERPSRPPETPPLVAKLRKSRSFRAQVEGNTPTDVDDVLAWLGVLVEAGAALSDREFARRCGTRAHRVGGLVARMGMLNIDGYSLVEHDRTGGQVILHRARLISQYGLSE